MLQQPFFFFKSKDWKVILLLSDRSKPFQGLSKFAPSISIGHVQHYTMPRRRRLFLLTFLLAIKHHLQPGLLESTLLEMFWFVVRMNFFSLVIFSRRSILVVVTFLTWCSSSSSKFLVWFLLMFGSGSVHVNSWRKSHRQLQCSSRLLLPLCCSLTL